MSGQEVKVFTLIRDFAVWFWGEANPVMQVFIMFLAANCITGIMCAVARKKISYEDVMKIIFRKIIVFLLIGCGHLLDVNILGYPGFYKLIIYYYIVKEGYEIIGNCEALGLEVPQIFKDILSLIRNMF